MNTDEIESNWNKYDSLCKRFSDPGLNSLIDLLGERMAICPFSIKTEYTGCYPGGLIDVTLRITSAMRRINDTLDDKLPTASILKVGLLHEIGRVGDIEQDHFLHQDSDWHRDKLGQLYKYNDALPKMTYAHRTLYLLQSFNVGLTREEWESIATSGGYHLEENRFYVGTKNTLGKILSSARMLCL
ncbi:MAG: hypothetical protein EBZ49_01570 [Proteobacteria bacterium]|nr:hypothetical protein [Pseudomonadota bacterium]